MGRGGSGCQHVQEIYSVSVSEGKYQTGRCVVIYQTHFSPSLNAGTRPTVRMTRRAQNVLPVAFA